MYDCRNCKFHRFKGLEYDRKKEYIAFPVNRELDFKAEKCLKKKPMQPNCRFYRSWPDVEGGVARVEA